MSRARKHFLLTTAVLIGLILLTWWVYYPPFARYFVGDDYIQFDYVKQFWERPYLAWQLFNPYTLTWYYRPPQNLWFLLNRQIFGYNPVGYYILQLAAHSLAVVLLYRVARQFGLSRFAAMSTAVLFAIHSHWVDVVTWISSIAIVMEAAFSLLTLSVWLSYLKRPSAIKLSLTFALTLLTLITHEEGVILPFFLLLILLHQRPRITPKRKKSRITQYASRITPHEIIFFILLGLITLAYLYVQFTRPNITLDATSRTPADLLAALSPAALLDFLNVTLFRFTFIYPILTLTGVAKTVFGLLALLLIGLWFWYGRWLTRLGLLWTAVHLAFIYFALYTQKPELYAGRHIYNAGMGLALAIGAAIDQLLEIGDWRLEIGKQAINLQSPISNLIISLLLLLAMGGHIYQVRLVQADWLANVLEEETARQQLREIIPTLTPENHIFAVRFPIAPRFMRSVAQVWYDLPLERPGGSLEHLRAAKEADPTYYVLDYADGRVYNLMPDLPEYDRTIFLWARATTPAPTVVSAPNGRQLALKLTPPPGQWQSLEYTLPIPQNSALKTAVLLQPGLAYRIRIQEAFEPPQTVAEVTAVSGEANWEEIAIPLEPYWGKTVTIKLEAQSADDTPAYWGNPRLIVER
ncbi:MAG: hypothetical protein HF973_05140 [Chloroflexi bacterium]|nr:hypothetical protein [Chloroflexota bacterium]